MNNSLERSELLFEEGYRFLQNEPKDSLVTNLKFVKPLQKAAKLKNGKAMFLIGFILVTGYKNVNVDLKRGNKILKKAYPLLEKLSTDNHDSLATKYLAKYYEIPLCDYIKDDSKVKTLNKLASSYENNMIDETKVNFEFQKEEAKDIDLGDSTNYDNLVHLIHQLNDQKDKFENVEIINGIKNTAELGNIRACIFLGNAYINGVYVDRDFSLAMLYYQKAEAVGSVKAKYLIGYNMLNEKVVSSKDVSKGLNKIYQAAKVGLPEALYFLGKVYFEGKYVKEDLDKAYFYFQSAASRGLKDANDAIRKVDEKRADYFSLKLHTAN